MKRIMEEQQKGTGNKNPKSNHLLGPVYSTKNVYSLARRAPAQVGTFKPRDGAHEFVHVPGAPVVLVEVFRVGLSIKQDSGRPLSEIELLHLSEGIQDRA